MKKRAATVERKTRETDIVITLVVDGSGTYTVDTGIPFLNHMLELFSKHALMDLTVRARGDIEVDYHHTAEDLGLVLGDALAVALLSLRNFKPEDFALSHPGGSLGRKLLTTVRDIMHQGERLPLVSPTAKLKEVVVEIIWASLT